MELFPMKISKTDSMTFAPALLGVAIDVSGSMQSSLRNTQMMDLSRLGGVEKGLSALLDDSQKLAQKYGNSADLPLRVFAYAFGLKVDPPYADLLTILRFAKGIENNPEFKAYIDASIERRRREAEQKGEQMQRDAMRQYGGLAGLARSYGFGGLVDNIARSAEEDTRKKLTAEAEHNVGRDVLDYLKNHVGDTTLEAGELVKMWAGCNGSFANASRFIFGATPMRGCLEEIERRFKREKDKTGGVVPDRILLIISDGEPSDGAPDEAISRMRNDGIIIACAYVTDSNIQVPRELRTTAAIEWPDGAKQMFALASPIVPPGESINPGNEALRTELEKSGWTAPRGARLFIQANHSDVLADFMRIVGTAVPMHQLIRRNLP